MFDHLERFLAVMEYRPVDRVPNWELGTWPQTTERWEQEGFNPYAMHGDWFSGIAELGMDPREFIPFRGSMIPDFEEIMLGEDERTVKFRDNVGRTRIALKEGTVRGGRMSMDTYVDFPVKTMQDWIALKHRFTPGSARYEPNWQVLRPEGWKHRRHPLVFGPNCSTVGFYWFARDLMGTEPLTFAFYDQPDLVNDIFETYADFLIESVKPILERTTVEYMCLNEDLAMKTGPLISPSLYKRFIFPRLKRVIDFCKSHGMRYFCIDTDGNPEAVVPMMMDAGLDILWPLERSADQDPVRLRQKFGKSLRLWGGVDKRILAQGPEAIDAHLRTFIPLIKEGGYIPTIDHTIPPDVSLANFKYYMASKEKLLRGEL